jgi:hypothetical protein
MLEPNSNTQMMCCFYCRLQSYKKKFFYQYDFITPTISPKQLQY